METNMSFTALINLLPITREVDFNTNLLKIKKYSVSHAKRNNILQELAFIGTFEELSYWVEKHTNGQKYISCPAHSSYEDRNSCLNNIQQLLFQSLKGENKRKDGRDLKLIKASENGDYYTIASILASAAWSYWKTYFLFNSGDTAFYANNHQKNEQKIDLHKAQIEHIGAAVSFQKARKKGAFQEILDFFETEEIFKNEDFEV